MQLIDSHCHLDDARFDSDRVELLQRARRAGVEQIVVPAVSSRGWVKLKNIAELDSRIYPAFGLHPWFCDQHREDDLQRLPGFLEGAVAVGECGLDAGLCDVDMQVQLHWLRAQLKMALSYDLPVIVHAYKAVDVVIREIRCFPGLRGVVHSFSGSLQQAEQLIDLGFYLGIGGAVTHTRATRLQAVVKAVAAERLLLETDAPDQSPAGRRGERNEPAFLIDILAHIATLRGTDSQALAATCNHNARELFRL